MFRHVKCGASVSLSPRPDNVKGGPEENVPGLREVITKEKKADGRGSASQPAWGLWGAGLSKGSRSLGLGSPSLAEVPQMGSPYISIIKQVFPSSAQGHKTSQEKIAAFQMDCFTMKCFKN